MQDTLNASDGSNYHKLGQIKASMSWSVESELELCEGIEPSVTIVPSSYALVHFSLNINEGKQVFAKVFQRGQLVSAVDKNLGAAVATIAPDGEMPCLDGEGFGLRGVHVHTISD